MGVDLDRLTDASDDQGSADRTGPLIGIWRRPDPSRSRSRSAPSRSTGEAEPAPDPVPCPAPAGGWPLPRATSTDPAVTQLPRGPRPTRSPTRPCCTRRARAGRSRWWSGSASRTVIWTLPAGRSRRCTTATSAWLRAMLSQKPTVEASQTRWVDLMSRRSSASPVPPARGRTVAARSTCSLLVFDRAGEDRPHPDRPRHARRRPSGQTPPLRALNALDVELGL